MTRTTGLAGACKDWWVACIAADTGPARRARAQLRRAGSVADALGVGATHELYRYLAAVGFDLRGRRDGPDRLALIAVVLGQVTDDVSATIAQQFGTGDPKVLSSLRFEALVRTKEPRQLMRPLARAVRIIKGGANVRRLAADLYWWNDSTRTNWCFEYHGATHARPDQKETKT